MKTVAVLYCDQPAMLERHLAAWRTWPAAARAGIELMVIDSCSLRPAAAVLRGCGLPVRVLRLQRAVPWNIGAARNLAFAQAGGDSVVALDCDQVLEAAEADYLAGMVVEPGHYYLPTLRDPVSGHTQGHHRHVMLCRRADFLASGGYDERWTGYESDHLYAPRRDACMLPVIDPRFAVMHHPDGGCTRWPRAGRHNARMRDTRAFTAAMGATPKKPTTHHLTPWAEVAL